MDDDIDEMQINKNSKLIPFYSLKELSSIARNEMNKNKTRICGIYPVANHFFMKNNISTNLKYIKTNRTLMTLLCNFIYTCITCQRKARSHVTRPAPQASVSE